MRSAFGATRSRTGARIRMELDCKPPTIRFHPGAVATARRG